MRFFCFSSLLVFTVIFYRIFSRDLKKSCGNIRKASAIIARGSVLFFVCSFYFRTLVVRSSWLQSFATAFVVPSFLAELPSANACRSSAYRSELLSELPKRRLDLRPSLSGTLAAFFVRKMLQDVLYVPRCDHEGLTFVRLRNFQNEGLTFVLHSLERPSRFSIR